MKTGIVYLVGAGPGDPELITVKALNVLRKAEVVVYDSLIPFSLLAEAPKQAELIAAGKRAGNHILVQEKINSVLWSKARYGKLVVRLKGGDPFLFGRGGEEALYLKKRGIEVRVIPGVSSSYAAPLAAGIPLTQRHVAKSVAFVSGSNSNGEIPKTFPQVDTLVILMPKKKLPKIAARLVELGFSPDLPAALVENGTKPNQRVIRKSLIMFVADSVASHVKGPALFIVGQTVALNLPLGEIYEQYTQSDFEEEKLWMNS